MAMLSVLTGVPATQLNTFVISSQLKIFLVVQWLRLCAPNAEGTGSIPGRETMISHAVQCSQKKNFFSNF